MAEVHDGVHTLPVHVLEVKTGGEFLSTPIVPECQEDAYSVFLADLNNYMNEPSNRQSFLPYQHFKKGELVAVHCKANKDDDERVWYRGRILSKYKNVAGITVKVLLVDCSSVVYVPGTLMKKLGMRFQDFPIQIMNCRLFGLKPITFIATPESLVSRQVAKKWDSSAKNRLQKLLRGASCGIVIHNIDEHGIFHVTLRLVVVDRHGRHNNVNINELFVEENYAVFEEPEELIGEVEDDAASTMSESSLQDLDEIQKALSPDEFKKLMGRRQLEQERFNLGLDSHRDENRDIFGPSAHESDSVEMRESCTSESRNLKNSEMKMVPASCADGVELANDQSCIDNEPLLRRGNVNTEKLLSMLKGTDPQRPIVGDPVLCSDKLSKDDRNVGDQHSKSRRTTRLNQDSPSVVENKAMPKLGPFGGRNIWSTVKHRKNEMQSSSTSESEIESTDWAPTDNNAYTVDSDNSQASASGEIAKIDEAGSRRIDAAKLRYEKECLKQQHKDRGDENSFQTANVTWQLLKVLGVGDAVRPRSQSTNSSADTEKVPAAYDDVLVCGDNKPKSVLHVEKLNVPNGMKLCVRSDLTNTLVTKPTPLQSYAWPAILRGRHVVGVDSTGSGKKLGYLLPILKQIVDSPSLYENLPRGHGPIVLILTTDWNEARRICKTCEKLLYSYRNRYRCRVLYGGRGNIQEEMVSLINGCEVLVSTIPPLLSMIEKHCTSLERLCHLIFDRAHILVENFAEEIKTLMRLYAESLSKTIALNLPHQMIAMSSEWSRGLESLLNAYFDNPLIIIPNKLEASVFKKVTQRVEICESDKRMVYVMSALRDSLAYHNVVIFVNSANEADHLGNVLESQCIGVLKATEFMSPVELKDIQTSWNYEVNKKKHHDFVLVMTDRVAARIPIRNATFIISYEFPLNKTDFGRRLSCLLEAMKDKTERSNDIISMVFLTEESESAAPAFARLLSRARQHPSPNLNSIARRINQQKEESAKSCEICEDLKYFGTCRISLINAVLDSYATYCQGYVLIRDAQKCPQRHTVFSESDKPKHIPKSGVVKVKILDVVSANVYWGKIIDHKLTNGANQLEAYDTKAYFKLAYDMQVFYAIKSNRRKHGQTASGVLKDDICVIKSEDGFQRVRVESIERRDAQTAIATEVYVFGLDNGMSQRASVNDLFLLPTDKTFSLENVPQQAIELIVCGVKPVDKSFSWTVEACVRMDKSITGKILEGKIALGLRNTLWLDPLVAKEKCDELNANITILHVGAYLLECGFAEKNRSHVKNLRDLCKDCLPSVINAVEVVNVEPVAEETRATVAARSAETVEMPESDFQDVYVSAVENPGLFFVQLWKNVEMLDKLEDKIEAVMKVLPKHEQPDISDIGRGSLCLAQFSLDDKWYRARVLEINEDLDYRVFYVDHGEIEWIHEKRLWKAWPELLQLPCQAIECSLVHISPKGQNWTSEDGDCLWNLCEAKLLVAQVKSKTGSYYAGANRYNIELYDTTGASTINISHELVFLGRALGSQDCIQEIFPDALWCPENRLVTNAIDCLPDLCLQIYRCEVATEQMELVRRLRNITDNANGDESTIIASTKSIVKLIALCQSIEVSSILIDAITCLMQKDENLSNEVVREGGLRTMCNLLNQEYNASNLVKVIAALGYFAKDPRNRQALGEHVCIESVCRVLKENKSNETTRLCLELVLSICKGNEHNREQIFEHGGLSEVVRLTSGSSDVKVLELCSIVLFDLAQNPRIREKLCETGVIDVAGAMVTRTTNKVCLLNCLTIMKIAVSNSQLHREYIKRLGIVSAIERILHRPMAEGIEVKRLCRYLLSDLKVNNELTGSGQQEIHVPKIEHGDEPPPLLSLDELPCVSPTTLWSQHEGDVTMAIQLRGVQNEEVEIGERLVTFRCFTDEFRYQLKLELFDAIIPESSSWQVYGGEVLILLKKLQKLYWPRLLLSKIKPPFLYIDFNRWALDVEDEILKKPAKLPPRSTNINDTNTLSIGVPDMYYGDTYSSDDEGSSSDLCDEYGPIT